MNRNWYAAVLLLALAVALCSAGRYVETSTGQLRQQLNCAYAAAEAGHYGEAQRAYRAVAQKSAANSKIWLLLVRRTLVDQFNQTLATLPAYATADNRADLAVETARACTQLQQIRQSFFSRF